MTTLQHLVEQMRAWAGDLETGEVGIAGITAGLRDVASDVEASRGYARETTLGAANHAELVGRAREAYADGSDDNVEIDDDAALSGGPDGCWVQAWVWIPDDAGG